jgi:hypothetical protein
LKFFESFLKMENNRGKKSKILNTSEFFEKFNNKNNFPTTKTANKLKDKSNLNSLPREILLKIFDFLLLDDLFTCSLVCKDWYNASNDLSLWINLTKLYKCQSEIAQISKEFEIDYKKALKRYFSIKRGVIIFKLGEKLTKKSNNYTGLPDLKSFQTDIGNLEWYLEFFDKRSNPLLSLKKSEFNNSFDAGFSAVWSNLNELTYQILCEVEKISILVNIPVYLDCKNGKLSSQNSKAFYYNINTEKTLIAEYPNFLKSNKVPKNNSLALNKIHEDSLINIQSVDCKLLIGYWNSDSKSDPVFITYNSIFDKNLVEKIYKPKGSKYKSFIMNTAVLAIFQRHRHLDKVPGWTKTGTDRNQVIQNRHRKVLIMTLFRPTLTGQSMSFQSVQVLLSLVPGPALCPGAGAAERSQETMFINL